ncbi:MAG: hypothetical protein CM15mP127_07880 [Gammaproteobacteria bacterium]|nr:MAG: hypothetical protein CM15mP127_07880 [Gammaproteobacteria bacterium]
MGNNGCDGSGPDGLSVIRSQELKAILEQSWHLPYRPTEDLTLYTTRASGYRPGGNNSPLLPFCAADPLARYVYKTL